MRGVPFCYSDGRSFAPAEFALLLNCSTFAALSGRSPIGIRAIRVIRGSIPSRLIRTADFADHADRHGGSLLFRRQPLFCVSVGSPLAGRGHFSMQRRHNAKSGGDHNVFLPSRQEPARDSFMVCSTTGRAGGFVKFLRTARCPEILARA